ncbi:MAG: DNA primase [Lentisphaeria bacterium]
MPRIPEATIDEIRNRCDIVDLIESYVPLKRQGKDYWACCPFHKEKTPSFKVSPEYQSYYCFGCQCSGNIYRFVMEQENTDFVGAVRLLARREGVIIPEEKGPADGKNHRGADREKLFDLHTKIAEWYQKCLKEKVGETGYQYLKNRGIDDNCINKFGLGFAPDSWDAALKWGERHSFSEKQLITAGLAVLKEDGPKRRVYDRFRGRLMFPIWDELGRVIGFSARTIDPEAKTAKYVNSPESPIFHKGKLLYALHLARPAFKSHGYALVCEGQLDAIACHRAGLDNAVAPQGTSFTEMQARILRRFTDKIVFAFDADAAGQKAAAKSLEVAAAANLEARVVALPEDGDPDSIFRNQGAEALSQTIEKSEDGFEFLLKLAQTQNPADSPHGKQAIVEQVLEVVAKLTQPVARAAHCQWLGQKMDLPEDAVYQTLNSILKRSKRGRRPASGRNIENDHRQNSTTTPAAGQRQPQKTATIPNAKTYAAKLMLLDLALHDGHIAHVLAEHEHLDPEELEDTPLDKALNLVLRKTVEDEWPKAGSALSGRTDLISDPKVAKVLADSQFASTDPANENPDQRKKREKKYQQIMEDCLLVLEKARIKVEIEKLQAAVLNPQTDNDARRELTGRCQLLAKRMAQLN